MTRKSLIVKLGAIGDVASVIPAAWKLHESGSTIDWLCGAGVAPLLSCYSWIRPIVVDDSRLLGGTKAAAAFEILSTWKSLIGAAYDLCAILQYDWRYRILTLPVMAHSWIALSRDSRRYGLISERHHSVEFARILCDLSDEYRAENLAPRVPDRLPVNPLPQRGRTRISIAPGGARNLLRDDVQRRWPLECYVALARILLAQGHEVVLTGGAADTSAAKAFSGLPIENRIGVWSIPETLAFYQSCDCVVTHDTGPLHLAGIAKCAVVGLFGPTAPSKALPRRDDVIAIWGGARLPCRPCYDGHTFAPCAWNGCMNAITPQRVASTVDSVLRNPGSEWRIESL